jgi:hypothetical protein
MPTTYAIPDGRVAMNAKTWSATGTNPISISGLAFAPDFVWAKSRGAGYSHSLYDTIRGAGANTELISDSTGAEGSGNQDQYGYLSSFGSTGFTATSGSTGLNLYFNDPTYPAYVAWCWKAGGTAVSNTAGSITSSVSANTTAGFSVVTYTGTGSLATVGHGLGVAPNMIIIKGRTGTANNWTVYHSAVGNTGALFLNLTNATDTGSAYWNNTSPTSSVFTINTGSGSNTSTYNYVAYCFAAVAGYSAFGSYTGNGSSDGPFVYLGFRPRWIMIKRTDSATGGSWGMWDSSRGTYNVNTPRLTANSPAAEDSYGATDFVSNGFKLRDTDVSWNGSGATYIYAAFAENPFKYANAR